MRDAAAALLRALADAADAEPHVVDQQATPWASATFSGARHRLSIRLPVPAASRIARAAALETVAIVGHSIVDLAVSARECLEGAEMTIEATTVENG